MTLVYDNHVKVVMWQVGIGWQGHFLCGFVIVIIITILNIFSFQEREQSLYGRDYNIAIRRNGRGTKAINCKDGIESVPVFCQSERTKLILGLFSQIVSINEEQNPAHRCVRKHSICSKTSRISFTCPGCKYHQRTFLVCAKTFFKFGYRFILTITESFLLQCRESGKGVFNPQFLD